MGSQAPTTPTSPQREIIERIDIRINRPVAQKTALRWRIWNDETPPRRRGLILLMCRCHSSGLIGEFEQNSSPN